MNIKPLLWRPFRTLCLVVMVAASLLLAQQPGAIAALSTGSAAQQQCAAVQRDVVQQQARKLRLFSTDAVLLYARANCGKHSIFFAFLIYEPLQSFGGFAPQQLPEREECTEQPWSGLIPLGWTFDENYTLTPATKPTHGEKVGDITRTYTDVCPHGASPVAASGTKAVAPPVTQTPALPGAYLAPPSSVANTDVQPGDEWVYFITDGASAFQGSETYRVLDTTGGTIETNFTSKGANGALIQVISERFDSTWHSLAEGPNRRAQFGDPDLDSTGGIQLPLTPGEQWKTSYTSIIQDGRLMRELGVATVMDWVQLSLETGLTFEAVRIHTVVRAGAEGRTIDLWYAPAANRFVKRIVDETMGGQVVKHTIEELAAYKRGASAVAPTAIVATAAPPPLSADRTSGTPSPALASTGATPHITIVTPVLVPLATTGPGTSLTVDQRQELAAAQGYYQQNLYTTARLTRRPCCGRWT